MKNLGWLFLGWMMIFLVVGCGAPTPDAAPTGLPPEAGSAPLPTELPTALPEPTFTPSPAPLAGAACLPGEWEPEDLRAQMERTLQESNSSAVVESVSGQVVYRFSTEGQFELAFEQFEVKLGGEVNGKTYHTISLLNGNAGARYEVDDRVSQLQLSDFGGEGVRMTVTVNDQPLFEENLSAWPAFFASLSGSAGVGETVELPEGEARLRFDCLENRLVMSRADQQPPVMLELARRP